MSRERGPRPSWPAPDQVRVVGVPREPLWRDIYHAFLTLPWWGALGILALGWATVNVVFAVLYASVGGVEGVPVGGFTQAFHFSVQTFGTIGYGVLHPKGPFANLLVDAESLLGMVLTAVATGLVFAKFARTAARMAFSERIAISPRNGVPTLALRVGNLRGNRIVDARFRVVLIRTEQLAEGGTFYRMIDLKLERDWAPALSRSFNVLHRIDAASPLYGVTPMGAREQELELVIVVTGVDETTMAPIHALAWYEEAQFAWGARYADVLSEGPDGTFTLDVRRFHALVPAEPTPDFPYQWSDADDG